VSSHLTIIQGGAAAKIPETAGGKPAVAGDALAAFAAILDALLGLGQAGAGDAAGADAEKKTPDALANPMAGLTGLASEAQAAHKAGSKDDKDKDEADDPLATFIDLLAQLDAALQSGQTPDPALLQKLDAAVADLSNLLGFDPDAPMTPGTGATGGNTLIDRLAGKAGELARTLDARLTQPLANVDADAAKAVANLTHRLDALAQKLESGLTPDMLGKLGFTAEMQLANADTAQKLDALVNGKVGLNAAASAKPDLAAPSLTPPEAKADKAAAGSDKAEKPDHKHADKKTDARKAEVIAARAEAKADTAAQTSDGPDTIVQPAQATSTQRLDATAQLRGPAAAYQPATQINIPHLAFEMVRQVHDGKSRFQIRLDPPDLGRIDVHMHVDNNGNVSARMTVDKAETLDLLQRDQSSLEKALAQAGLDGNKPNLEFSLRQNPFARPDFGQQQQSGGRQAFAGDAAETGAIEAEPAPTLYRGTVSAAGVNLFV
jgi:flagellar hook-length control protein FliK